MIPRTALLGVLTLLAVTRSFAQGGPPMITDDPDTPGNRNWEINTNAFGAFSHGQSFVQAPYLDINYGLGDYTQLKLEGGATPAVHTGTDNQSGAGPGTVLVGVKWRFLDQDQVGLNVSIYPQFDFHVPYGPEARALAPPGNYWLLPIQFSRHWGPYALNPDIGYVYSTRTGDGWFYGLIGDYEVWEDFELLAEIHSDEQVQGGGDDWLVNLGTRFPFNKKVLLLASAGRIFKPLPGAPAQYIAYLGLQFRL